MKRKEHDSDDENQAEEIEMEEIQDDSIETDKKGNELSQYEIDKIALENAPVISSRERSPAAFIFSQTRQERDQILFEEKS